MVERPSSAASIRRTTSVTYLRGYNRQMDLQPVSTSRRKTLAANGHADSVLGKEISATKVISTPKPSHQLLVNKNREMRRLDKVLQGAEKRIKDKVAENPPTIGLKHYTLASVIGEGAFGKVRIGKSKLTDEDVAVKVFEKSALTNDHLKSQVRREIAVLGSLHHPHITRMYQTLETKQRIFVIMEYCEGGTLGDLVNDTPDNRLDEKHARRIFRQVLDAVSFCHQQGVTHRDLKMENMLMKNGNIKVADFGLSVKGKAEWKLSGYCGTPKYAAPEVTAGGKYLGGPVDSWSLGVLLYRMVTGAYPFWAATETLLKKAVMKGKFDIPSFVSPLCRELIRGLMKMEPSQRLSPAKALVHDWMMHEETPVLKEDPLDKLLDADLLKQMSDLGFEPSETVRSLTDLDHTLATATYSLLIQKKGRERKMARDNLRKSKGFANDEGAAPDSEAPSSSSDEEFIH